MVRRVMYALIFGLFGFLCLGMAGLIVGFSGWPLPLTLITGSLWGMAGMAGFYGAWDGYRQRQ